MIQKYRVTGLVFKLGLSYFMNVITAVESIVKGLTWC